MIVLRTLGSDSLVFTPIRAKGLSFSLVTSDRSWGEPACHFSQYCDQRPYVVAEIALLRKQLPHDVAFDVGQAEVAAGVPVGQPFVI